MAPPSKTSKIDVSLRFNATQAGTVFAFLEFVKKIPGGFMNTVSRSNWYALAILSSCFLAGMLAACGSSGGGSGSGTSGINVPYIPSNCVGSNCSYGYGYGGILFGAQTAANYGNGYSYGIGSLSIGSGYTTMLQDAMGTCNRNLIYGGSNGGNTACSAFANGINSISFSMNDTSGTNTILSVASYPTNTGYYYNLPSASGFLYSLLGFGTFQSQAALYNPMNLQAALYSVNANGGFEIRASGPAGSYGYNKLLQLIVSSGSLTSSQVSFNLYYNSVLAASGSMVSCSGGICQ